MTSFKPAARNGRKYLNPVPTAVGGLSTFLKVLPLFLSNREGREPTTAPGPYRTDPAVYGSAPASGLRVTWFGHSSLLLEIDGFRILVDPVWDERASPVAFFGPKRFFAPTIALEDLPTLDAILVSHDHYDHLGARTIRALAKLPALAHTKWITSAGVGRKLLQFGVVGNRIEELDWSGSTSLTNALGDRLRITSWPARHFSGRGLHDRFRTLWASFVLEGHRHRVYFGADSGWWNGFAEIGAYYPGFDLVMLEIGAYHPLWGQIHLGPDAAADAFEAIKGSSKASLLMPIHWGLFNLALHKWQQPIERIIALAQERSLPLWSPEPGRPTDVVGPLIEEWWRQTS